MLIAVANLRDRYRESGWAVSLACELAGIDSLSTDRWQGRHSVILFTLMPAGEPHHCCETAQLPVSCEHVPLDDSRMERRIHRISSIAKQVDYAVIDCPPYLHPATKTILGISELVVVPCSVADREAAAAMIELIRIARSSSSDGGPKYLLVPREVEETTSLKNLETVVGKFGQTIGPAHHEIKALAARVWRMTAGDAEPGTLEN